MNRATSRGCLLFVLCLGIECAAAADLTIDGVAPKPQAISVAELKQACAAKMQSIDYTNRSGKHHANAVPLIDAVAFGGVETTIAASPNASPAGKHPPLRMAVIVRGSDGYAVVFSLAELMLSVGHRSVWLATDQDDAPLPAADGPLKLIVPDDAAPARAVHSVSEIEIVDLSKPATQPIAK